MKSCLCLLVLAVALGLMVGSAHAWYPSAAQVEFATATW